MNQNLSTEKILVLGARGLVGSALIRALKRKDAHQTILAPPSSELDLLKQDQTLEYFSQHRPTHVYLAAAKVGGILANNTYRADFIFENLQIQNHVFEAAVKFKTEKLLFLGSSCIYPKKCPQPIKEEALLTGPLEETNEPYAIAKIAGLKMAENYRRQYGKLFFSVMPTNLYGENDNFDPENSHLVPGLIRRMDRAMKEGKEEFLIWGTGKPRRELLYVDDMAEACLHIIDRADLDSPYLINIGTGVDHSISEIAHMIAKKLNFKGQLSYDSSKPDGTMLKRCDVSRLHALGWQHKVSLDEGLDKTISFYREHYA